MRLAIALMPLHFHLSFFKTLTRSIEKITYYYIPQNMSAPIQCNRFILLGIKGTQYPVLFHKTQQIKTFVKAATEYILIFPLLYKGTFIKERQKCGMRWGIFK